MLKIDELILIVISLLGKLFSDKGGIFMIALIHGKILTMVGQNFDDGVVLIEGRKIKAVGADVEIPTKAEVLDLSGKWILPGLIDAHSHVGLYGEPSVWANMDVNEDSTPNTPQLRAIDAINPDDPAFQDIRRAGFTTVYTGPGSANIIGGIGIAIKTIGQTIEEMILPGTEGMKFALGENPKRVHGRQHHNYPTTRMGNAALLREALVAATNYLAKFEAAEAMKVPERDLHLEALGRVLQREIKARIHCHRKDDILTAIRIAEEFNLDYIIEHCTEGYKIADYLAQKKVKVTVGPLFMGRSKMELNQFQMANPGVLNRAGVLVALQMDGGSETQWLPLAAGLAVREGMDEKEAFKALTINAAKILGVAERIGSLEPGKDADLAVFSGNPFHTYTICERTYINGQLVYQR